MDLTDAEDEGRRLRGMFPTLDNGSPRELLFPAAVFIYLLESLPPKDRERWFIHFCSIMALRIGGDTDKAIALLKEAIKQQEQMDFYFNKKG